MAVWVVSDVIGRLLGYVSQWRDEEHIGDPYFGGRDKLNRVEEMLKMLQPQLLRAQDKIFKKIEGKGDAADDPMEEWLKRAKRVLYEMEELFEEVGIAERERQQIPAGCDYKLIRPLWKLLASNYNPTLFKVQKRVAQQVQALMGDLAQMGLGEDANEGHYVDDLSWRSRHKQCMAYCCLFPKAYEFNKTDLIYRWMAQGFLDGTWYGSHHETPQQVGHQYFVDSFLTYILKEETKNEIGDVISCNMKDEYHHIFHEEGRGECLLVDDEHGDLIDSIDNSIHHVSFIIVGSSWEAPPWLLAAKQLRSLILLPRDSGTSVTIQNLEQLLSCLTCLRALDLGCADLCNLPDSIGGLKHLRYLKLGGPLKSLPHSITKLHYLQTLDLQACPRLLKVPKGTDNFKKNVTLVCTAELNQFTVDENNGLDALVGSGKALGKFEIFFKRRRRGALSEASKADLRSKLVNDLVFEWLSSYQVSDADSDKDKEESVLKRMKPPQSLKSLALYFWKGSRLPSWETSPYINLPNLVSVEIEGCSRCTYLPSFSQLPSLRFFRLANFRALEYIDNVATSGAHFPSLESLKLEDMPELKGWSRKIQQLIFPQLSELRIHLCRRLMSMPQAPRLKLLTLEEIHGKLLKHLQYTQESQTTLRTPSTTPLELHIASVSELHSLSIYAYTGASQVIKRCEELVHLNCATSKARFRPLVKVEIYSCERLRDISGQVEWIIELIIWRCEKLNLWDMIEDDGGGDHMGSAAWRDLKWLRSLTLGSITKLESLPRGLACFSVLQELKIFQLRNLRALPRWIGHLTQLRKLDIVDCSNMRTLFVSSVHEVDSFRINLPDLTIKIERCHELIDNLFEGTPISFKRLIVYRCDRLKDISGEEVFKELLVDDCRELHLWEVSEVGSSSGSVKSAAWQGLKSLSYLKLERISKLESLPRGMACLTALEQLEVSQLHNLRELPEWIGHLSQLQCLEIKECPKVTALPECLCELTLLRHLFIGQCNPKLESRCQETTGEDWPKLKHIPEVKVE